MGASELAGDALMRGEYPDPKDRSPEDWLRGICDVLENDLAYFTRMLDEVRRSKTGADTSAPPADHQSPRDAPIGGTPRLALHRAPPDSPPDDPHGRR
jgi:hypothetical protein